MNAVLTDDEVGILLAAAMLGHASRLVADPDRLHVCLTGTPGSRRAPLTGTFGAAGEDLPS